MKAPGFTESVVEEAALAWLEGLGWQVLHGPEVALGESGAESNFGEMVLAQRVRDAVAIESEIINAE
jgi:type I restriction enzyme R subunit